MGILLFFIRFIITTVVVVVSAHYIPEIEIKDLTDAIFFGLTLGLINAFIRPIIMFLAIPINFVTLGLFSLVINGFTYWLASEISYGVYISSLWGAFWGGLVVWLTSIIVNLFTWKRTL
ncbi:hypothetical protein COB11_07720 [Candidatus Aerophobetes bacterium]|uniref:Phage holin family protein n=1 Tax=Aerophobetes bacterium TaxID=2030807 RepID=A0A2A4YCG7_UNCAE|nr:MAG: hypothetical protein COB11_07720 [Candidatus Aerophobetes bacterium]